MQSEGVWFSSDFIIFHKLYWMVVDFGRFKRKKKYTRLTRHNIYQINYHYLSIIIIYEKVLIIINYHFL